MSQITRKFKALSDDLRLRILWFLKKEELNVQELMFILNMSQSRISHHLSILKEAGFISDRHEGTFVYYRLNQDENNDAKLLLKLIDNKSKTDLERLKLCLKKRTDKSKLFFKRSANKWDAIRKNLYDEVVILKAINRIIPQKYIIADLGTGTGSLLPYLSEIATEVIGIDNSREMLKIAKQNLKSLNIKNVRLKCGNIEKTLLNNKTVNAVFANMVLHHSAKPILAIKEMHRILKNKGKVVITDLVKHNIDEMRDKMGDLWLGFEKKEVVNWIKEAGFTNINYSLISSLSDKNQEPKLEIFIIDALKEK